MKTDVLIRTYITDELSLALDRVKKALGIKADSDMFRLALREFVVNHDVKVSSIEDILSRSALAQSRTNGGPCVRSA